MKHATTMLALLCNFLVFTTGCNQSANDNQSIDDTYEELIRMRLDAEERIFSAMALHRETSQTVHKRQAELKKYLPANKSVPETIKLFQKGIEIPSELDVAYSCWLTLFPDVMLLEQIEDRINEIKTTRLLEEMEIAIKTIDNQRKLGTLNNIDRSKIDPLFARLISSRSLDEIFDTAKYETKAIERMKKDLAR